jgi:hypothetical protein
MADLSEGVDRHRPDEKRWRLCLLRVRVSGWHFQEGLHSIVLFSTCHRRNDAKLPNVNPATPRTTPWCKSEAHRICRKRQGKWILKSPRPTGDSSRTQHFDSLTTYLARDKNPQFNSTQLRSGYPSIALHTSADTIATFKHLAAVSSLLSMTGVAPHK